MLQAEVRQLQQNEKEVATKVRRIEADTKNAQEKRETYSKLFDKYDKFDDIDWWSCALVIQQKEEQKRQLELSVTKHYWKIVRIYSRNRAMIVLWLWLK